MTTLYRFLDLEECFVVADDSAAVFDVHFGADVEIVGRHSGAERLKEENFLLEK